MTDNDPLAHWHVILTVEEHDDLAAVLRGYFSARQAVEDGVAVFAPSVEQPPATPEGP